MRTHEARASLAALGVTEHHLLGISDGTCAAQPPDAVVRRLAQIIHSVAPDTILTFGPDGMTGHEDHQTVSSVGHCSPRRRALRRPAAVRDHHRGVRRALGAVPRGVQHVPRRRAAAAHPGVGLAVALRLDQAMVDRKIVALRAQASQTQALIAALGEERVRDWWSTETFVAPTPPRRQAELGNLAGGGMNTVPGVSGSAPSVLGQGGRDAITVSVAYVPFGQALGATVTGHERARWWSSETFVAADTARSRMQEWGTRRVAT